MRGQEARIVLEYLRNYKETSTGAEGNGGYYLEQQNLHNYLGSGKIPNEVYSGHK